MLDSAFNERLHLNPLFSFIAVNVGQRHARKQRRESDDQALNQYKDDQKRILDLEQTLEASFHVARASAAL